MAPVIPVTGVVFDEVQVDGIYLGERCCLIAVAAGKVVAFQWCDREKQVAWEALMSRLPAPRVVVTDGGSGIGAALKSTWPDTRVQRCLVHVQRNTRTDLTTHPRTEAGKALWALGRALTGLDTPDKAATWMGHLNDWWGLYGQLTKERTYAASGTQAPSWTRAGQQWWYTHAKLRSAYRRLAHLVKQGTLFTYLDPEFAGLQIASTTNHIEGGINSQLRRLLATHRGMPPHHQRRAVEWWCYLHCETPTKPSTLVKPHHWQPAKPKPITSAEPTGPALYDTATTAEEGLWARKRWAGRST